jgi:hypothetical protein
MMPRTTNTDHKSPSPSHDNRQHTTHPQPHEQLLMGWMVGRTMMYGWEVLEMREMAGGA